MQICRVDTCDAFTFACLSYFCTLTAFDDEAAAAAAGGGSTNTRRKWRRRRACNAETYFISLGSTEQLKSTSVSTSSEETRLGAAKARSEFKRGNCCRLRVFS